MEHKILRYRGVTFDEFTKDKYGMWTSICKRCREDSGLLDNGDRSAGVCSVKGCTNSNWDDSNKEVSYIDLNMDEVIIENEKK